MSSFITENKPKTNMQTIQLPNAEFLPHVCELVEQGEKVMIRAKGNSMRPFLESGRDIAILSKITVPKVGDVVLAEIAPKHYVLHRIDKINDTQITLRGDGNVRGVELCKAADLRAIAIGFVRNGKNWTTESRIWKAYSLIWPRLLPFRRILLAIYRLLWLGQLPQRITNRLRSKKV